jgi:sugar phosphate isomerase/epimerase
VGAAAAAGTWLARNGGGTLVLHTGFPLENWYPRRWGAFLGSLNELLDTVPGNVRFAVENTPIPSGRVEIVMDIVARYPEDRVGVCLDLGHAHIGGDVGNAIRESAPRLIHVHASDNHGDRDDHLVPGRGGIPWKEVFAQLREIGFPGPFTVELRDTTRGDDPHDRSFEEILGECRSALASFQGEGG